MLLVGAVLCEAFYAVIGKRLTTSLGSKRITSIVNLWGFALSTPFGLYLAWRFDFGSVAWSIWGLLLFYALAACVWTVWLWMTDRKSTRLNSSHVRISYAVFCLKKKTINGSYH